MIKLLIIFIRKMIIAIIIAYKLEKTTMHR